MRETCINGGGKHFGRRRQGEASFNGKTWMLILGKESLT